MKEIAACILAGGKNRRMNGRKKAFLTYQGSAFLDVIRENLQGFSRIYLSVEKKDPYEKWCEKTGVLPVEDRYPDTGPMGGIASVLESCSEEAVLMIPCDMIFLSEETIRKMTDAWRKSGKSVLFAGDRKGPGTMESMLPGIYTQERIGKMEQLIRSGDYKLWEIWEKEAFVTVEQPEKQELENVNRMEDYQRLARVTDEEAVRLLNEAVNEIRDQEEVAAEEAAGRILAEDLRAAFDQPPFPRSPLDGYAIRAKDSAGASWKHPVRLKVVEKIFAGEKATKKVGKGEAIRLMTGAPIPEGADAVIRQENTRGTDQVEICEELRPWQNYCQQGEDFRKGDVLLEKGRYLDAAAIGVAASMGYDRIPVRRRIRAAVFSTGEELLFPGVELTQGKIYDSNSFLIAGWLREMDVELVMREMLPDDADIIQEKIRQAKKAGVDLILTSGGVSVGEKDLLPDIFDRPGIRLLFPGVRVKPGAPARAGMYGETTVIALSGNPFGVMAHLELLVRPVLVKLSGSAVYEAERRQGVLADDFPRSCKDLRLVRGIWKDGEVSFPAQHGSGALSSVLECNCLAEIRDRADGIRKGETVWVRMLGKRP